MGRIALHGFSCPQSQALPGASRTSARIAVAAEPIIWMSRSNGRRPAGDMDFVRERRARRYNPQSEALLAAWIKVLLCGQETARVSAFGGVDGIDAAFVIDSTTAY